MVLVKHYCRQSTTSTGSDRCWARPDGHSSFGKGIPDSILFANDRQYEDIQMIRHCPPSCLNYNFFFFFGVKLLEA